MDIIDNISFPSDGPVKHENHADGMDDLDRLLAGYKTEMEVPNVAPLNNSATVAPINGTSQPGPLPNPNNTPLGISRDVNANTYPKQEYYQRGAKKGQPKPPKKGQPAPAPIQNNSLAVSTLITGAMFITLIDLLFPLCIAGLNNLFNKVKIDPEKMKMSTAQKNDLTPHGDAVARELKLSGSPTVLMLIALTGVYGFQYMVTLNQAKKQSQTKKTNDEKGIKNVVENNGRENVSANTY